MADSTPGNVGEATCRCTWHDSLTSPALLGWAHLKIGPDEAAAWRHSGFRPMEAALVHLAVANPEDARLWALTGLTPTEVHELAAAGASPWAYLPDRG